MYLIPKNIKTRTEIFKGIGIIEMIIISCSLIIGFGLSILFNDFNLKIVIFSVIPIVSLIILLPLPTGKNFLNIIKKFIMYKKHSTSYKK